MFQTFLQPPAQVGGFGSALGPEKTIEWLKWQLEACARDLPFNPHDGNVDKSQARQTQAVRCKFLCRSKLAEINFPIFSPPLIFCNKSSSRSV